MITLAMTLNMLHLMYYQLVIHFDLFSSGGTRRATRHGRWLDSIVGGAFLLFPLIALRSGSRMLTFTAAAILLVMLTCEFLTWWLSHLQQGRKEVSGETDSVVPSRTPELRQRIMHALTFGSFVSTGICCFIN